MWEFFTDIILNGNSQNAVGLIGREAIMDTMVDIVCDFVGGIVGAIVCLVIEIKNKNDKGECLDGKSKK